MPKIGRNSPCPCGSGKKYKKCCLGKDERKEALRQRVAKMSRRDLVSGPYKKCPNPKCAAENAFGVFTIIEGSHSYMRECIKCGYREEFDLPNIKKKVLYLDQFVISNLIKLLDKSHPSHKRIKAIPFWESLFIKLEAASKSQAIVCPDSFYHKDESLAGNMDFRLMKNLYKYFSSGKTLYPSIMIARDQITQHFEEWLANKKVDFNFEPENIAFEKNLYTWSVGLRVSVGWRPYPGQIESLQKTNIFTEEQLKIIWKRWQSEVDVGFIERVREETLSLGKGLIDTLRRFTERRNFVMAKIAAGQNYNLELDDFLPPMSNEILEALVRIVRAKGVPGPQIPEIIVRYLNDADSLLEIPQIRISSVMLAGWAHKAALGKKDPPKSTVDVQFISSYLPYCDALFVDKESALVLKEFPRNTPSYLRLKEFSAKIFSLNNKDEFLDYLDQLVAEIPSDQINILKDINGDNYAEPYWGIIEYEKKRIKDETL
jgi:Zn ribbon nucleic-acid-binding protein